MSHGIYSLVRNTDIKVINNYSCNESCKKKSLELQDPDLVFGGKERLPEELKFKQTQERRLGIIQVSRMDKSILSRENSLC